MVSSDTDTSNENENQKNSSELFVQSVKLKPDESSTDYGNFIGLLKILSGLGCCGFFFIEWY